MNGKGYPKGKIKGNLLCWYGNFEWIAKFVTKPEQKLLKKWNYRKKTFGDVNRGRDLAVKSLYTTTPVRKQVTPKRSVAVLRSTAKLRGSAYSLIFDSVKLEFYVAVSKQHVGQEDVCHDRAARSRPSGAAGYGIQCSFLKTRLVAREH